MSHLIGLLRFSFLFERIKPNATTTKFVSFKHCLILPNVTYLIHLNKTQILLSGNNNTVYNTVYNTPRQFQGKEPVTHPWTTNKWFPWRTPTWWKMVYQRMIRFVVESSVRRNACYRKRSKQKRWKMVYQRKSRFAVELSARRNAC